VRSSFFACLLLTLSGVISPAVAQMGAATPAAPGARTPQGASPSTPQQPSAPVQPPANSTARAPQVFTPAAPLRNSDSLGSTYIPLDSWMYPELLRLYSMGFLDTAYLGMRPWTRASVAHMLQDSADAIYNSGNGQAMEIYEAVEHELSPDFESPADRHIGQTELGSVYTRMMGIAGTPLRDSFHVGQSLVNDYGRPYAGGFNNVSGFSTRSTAGRFSLEFRGEFQHAPAYPGYSAAVAQTLSTIDESPFVPNNPTIPFGPDTNAQSHFSVLEANAAVLLASHEISFGKSDEWFGPGLGGGMGYSNNAEDIYSFRINRVEPLYIPYLSRVLGPVRYDFLVGSLQGHTDPNHPYSHSEGFSFKPTGNFEFGFERTVVWGGKGHEPVTLHTFLVSFFSLNDTNFLTKIGRNDPGARFSAFNFTYRVPYVRNWLTFYVDSEVHDDVTPPSAPRRAAFRPGLYLSQFPGARRLSLRAEVASTDPDTGRSINGSFMYWEAIQRQAYTNKGFLFGDWIGRESKGGQAWLTYHLSGDEWLQLQYRNAKAAKDFIPGGTTQNLFTVQAVKRLGKDVELNGWVQYEKWRAPLIEAPLASGAVPPAQSDTTTAVSLTWYPTTRVVRY
jgi:hypothetical protein